MGTSKIAWKNDLLDRAEKARFLTSYIDNEDHITVFNINSPWGTGKTFFLQNWRLELLDNRATVYFNAWEKDFSRDPLISLIATIREQLEKCLPESDANKEKLRKFVAAAGSAVVATAPVVIKQITKKFTGIDSSEFPDATAGSEKNIDATPDIAEKFVEHVIESNKKIDESVDQFKRSLQKLIDEARREHNGKPVYIFIDELDRCRPTYSIELLERIKHLFTISGCKFIIATDTIQLAHSINAVYGSNFASSRYLKRFFDVTYSLPPSSLQAWTQAHITASNFPNCSRIGFLIKPEHIYRAPNQTTPKKDCFFSDKLSEEQAIIQILADTFKTDLRELEKIKNSLISIARQDESKSFHFFFAAYLLFINSHDEDLMKRFLTGQALSLEKLNQKYPSQHSLYIVTENVSVHELANRIMVYTLMDRSTIYQALKTDNPEYLSNLLVNLSNGHTDIQRYPEYVTLARGLE